MSSECQADHHRHVSIAADERRMLSAVNLLEAYMVMRGRYGEAGADALENLLDAIEVVIVAFDEAQAKRAFAAFTAYGKGMNPATKLNLCDCVAYALAKSLEPRFFSRETTFAQPTSCR
jgi:ribonuclease VapC